MPTVTSDDDDGGGMTSLTHSASAKKTEKVTAELLELQIWGVGRICPNVNGVHGRFSDKVKIKYTPFLPNERI